VTTYYRTSGKTSRAKCVNCGRPFKEHKLVRVDRRTSSPPMPWDGELYSCPRMLKRSASTGRLEVLDNGKNTRAAEEAGRLLDAVKRDVLDHFKLGRFACKKKLANGVVLKVELRMPPLNRRAKR